MHLDIFRKRSMNELSYKKSSNNVRNNNIMNTERLQKMFNA